MSNPHTKTLEYWVLRVVDSDLTWFGFNWMRPAKQERIGSGYILFSSILLGCPGIALGAGAIYLLFGRVDPMVWCALFLFAMAFEVPMHLLFAHFWNRRAQKIGAGSCPIPPRLD